MVVHDAQRRGSWIIQDNRHTQNSPGAVCVVVLAVNQQEEETPLGCKSTKLLVRLGPTVITVLQTPITKQKQQHK